MKSKIFIDRSLIHKKDMVNNRIHKILPEGNSSIKVVKRYQVL